MPPSKPKPKKKAPPRRGPWRRVALVAVLVVFWGAVIIAGTVAYFAYDMPQAEQLAAPVRRPSITLVDADGRTLLTYGDLYGDPVTLKSVPDHLVKAVLATEDRRFWTHGGFDPW